MHSIDSQEKYTDFLTEFRKQRPDLNFIFSEPLKNHTTWRVGGPSDLFLIVRSVDELIFAVNLARINNVPYFVLGGGANILVSDAGYRGLTIKNTSSSFSFVEDPLISKNWVDHSTGEYKHTAVHFDYYSDTSDPSFGAEPVFLQVDSGYSMPHFIRDTLKQGMTGLERFARIPGTLGGWVYNNVHGHTRFIGDYIYSLRVLNEQGEIKTKLWSELDFGYDYSIFHTNKEIILDVILRLFKGNTELGQALVREVTLKKNEHQPANSAGCVFHNISPEDTARLGFESSSVGYIVDKKLGWLGSHKIGGAWISSKHGNFIETDGTASAQDVLQLINLIRQECLNAFGLELKIEIFTVGEF